MPCVCLRIATGAGKTLLAAYAAPTLARELRVTDAPVVLWLVPSDTIRSQTLKRLQTAGNPCSEALEMACGARRIAAQHHGQRVVQVRRVSEHVHLFEGAGFHDICALSFQAVWIATVALLGVNDAKSSHEH